MKLKSNQITTEHYKNILVKELGFIVNKMDQASKAEEKLYFFSAVQGVLHRILNLEYSRGLLIAHYITNETLKLFQQRLTSYKAGDIAVSLSEYQFQSLTELTRELREAIMHGESIDEVLSKYIVLLYSTTGNGYYLMEKGVLKI
jgi:hypothetical protein